MSKFIVLLIISTAANANPLQGDINSKVVGGVPVNSSVPYQGSLSAYGVHFCGCSIIKANWVLTAAHCAAVYQASIIKVLVGTTVLSSGGQSYDVDLVVSHPDFTSNFPMQNDVAVMRLTSDIELNIKVNMISLAQVLPEDKSYATLTGWGDTAYPTLEGPDKLQTIDLQIISLEYCSSKFGLKIPKSSLCTLNGHDEGACYGDSGGPLVHEGLQVGIVSWGSPCAINYPDVFASVPDLYSWIIQTINSE